MHGDQQFIHPVFSQHIDPNTFVSMTIACKLLTGDCLDRMKPVSTNIAWQPARLQATQDVMPSHCLVFDADGRMGINPPFS